MSAAELTSHCPVCGAEESLDALLHRMVEDGQVRRLIADVVERSLPLGSLVVRYLRLHKPPKHKLRMERVAAVLAELVPDMKRGAITRKGRDWPAGTDAWKLAFMAVFDAIEKGTLKLPLTSSVYLYEVLMRVADKCEGAAERSTEGDRRAAAAARTMAPETAYSAAPVATVLHTGPAPAAPPAAVLLAAPTGPSPYARKLRAEIEAKRAAQVATTADTTTTESSDPQAKATS